MSRAWEDFVEVSRKLAADMSPGREYPLSNEDLRSFYGLGRVTAKARASIAISLEQAGLDVLSDPSSEPLVVAKPAPVQTAAAPPPSSENPGTTRRRSLIALGVLVLLVIVGIALSGGDEEPQQAANPAPAPTTETTPAPTKGVAR